jgi:hypothetical protein
MPEVSLFRTKEAIVNALLAREHQRIISRAALGSAVRKGTGGLLRDKVLKLAMDDLEKRGIISVSDTSGAITLLLTEEWLNE